MRLTRLLVALAAAACLLSGCRTDHLALRATDRIAIDRPTTMERVALPVTVRWRAKNVTSHKSLSGSGPFFAVFVDRAPVPAGTGLRTLVDSDCRKKTNCPDLTWFADRNVYLTGRPSITLGTFPSVGGGTRTAADNTHRVTIVLIGPDGVRLDESAASIEFEVVST